MKIAILASDKGEKALHLYEFFREGNRVEVDCLITDTEQSPLRSVFEREGIPVFDIEGTEWADGEKLNSILKSREAEIIVVDDLKSPLPESTIERYGKVMIYPTGPLEAPGEVVQLYNKLLAETAAETKRVEKGMRDLNSEPTVEEEWAEALKVNYEEPQPSETEDKEEHAIEEKRELETEPTPPEDKRTVEDRVERKDFERPFEPMPDTYLVWSVLATVFCCLVPGIIAIIYSSSVSTKYFARDMEGARRASRRAQIWVIVSVVCGILWISLYLPLMLLAI